MGSLPRETGSEKYEAVCFNCGGPCPTVESSNGSLSPGPCPKCYPTTQTAVAAPEGREVGTDVTADQSRVDANVLGKTV
jgi:reverse gyrase